MEPNDEQHCQSVVRHMSERADHLGMEREKACSSILPFIRFHHFNHNNSYRPCSKRRPALADRFLHGDGRAQQQQAPRRPRLLHAAPAPPICASRRPRRPPSPPTARRRRPRTRTRRGPSMSYLSRTIRAMPTSLRSTKSLRAFL